MSKTQLDLMVPIPACQLTATLFKLTSSISTRGKKKPLVKGAKGEVILWVQVVIVNKDNFQFRDTPFFII